MRVIVENANRQVANVPLDLVSNPGEAACFFATFGIEDAGKKYQVTVRIADLDVATHTARMFGSVAGPPASRIR